jgi:hypothetical protein
VVLHLQEMDKLGFATATLYNLGKVGLRLLDEVVDTVLICEDTVLLLVLENT